MRRQLRTWMLCMVMGVMGISVQGLQAQTFHPDYLDGHLYLKLEDTTTINLEPYTFTIPALNLILTTFGVDSLYRPFKSGHPALQNIYRLEFSNLLGADNLITQLELLSFVDYAEKVPLMQPIGETVLVPNDLQLSQWSLPKIQADLAWGMTLGSSTVTVAVVDNAIRVTHEDLAPVIFTNPSEANGLPFFDDDLNGYTDDSHGFDVADLDADVNPPAGQPNWDHGTHCSGIAGAATDNGIGLASIGYGISIMPVKASNDATGPNTMSRAYEGVDYARATGADVISMSWGSHGISSTGELILALAQSEGVLLVAAAGNNGDSVPFYPAASTSCLAVGSTDQNDIRSPFSNYGSYVDVMAPGSDIISCLATGDNAYGTQSGTSMACPLTAGLAGLIWSAAPSLNDQQVRTMIVNGCINIDALNPGFAGQLGAGRINAFNSLYLTGMDAETMDVGPITVYPNPARDRVQFIFPEDWTHEAVTVDVYSLAGELKQRTELNPVNASMECAEWAAGVYLLHVRQGEQMRTHLLKVE